MLFVLFLVIVLVLPAWEFLTNEKDYENEERVGTGGR